MVTDSFGVVGEALRRDRSGGEFGSKGVWELSATFSDLRVGRATPCILVRTQMVHGEISSRAGFQSANPNPKRQRLLGVSFRYQRYTGCHGTPQYYYKTSLPPNFIQDGDVANPCGLTYTNICYVNDILSAKKEVSRGSAELPIPIHYQSGATSKPSLRGS